MSLSVLKSPCFVLTVIAAMLLSSCMVGPKYTRPSVPAPPNFTESQGWATAQPSDAKMRGDWWELFEDPQLTALELQVGPANQTLKAAEANFRRARALIQINRSFLYPTVSAGAGISHNRTAATSSTGLQGEQYGDFALPISVSYDADLWGRVRRSIAASREQFQASAADLENVKLELQTDLAADYFEANALDSDKQILEQNVVAFRKALELTSNRYLGGVASKAEVTQAQTQLEQTEAQELDVAAARAQLNHAIAVLIGKAPEQFTLPPHPLEARPPSVPIGVPSLLLQRRPDIASAERQVAAANEQIGIARSAFFPDLLISATGGLQAGSIVDWFTWPARYWAVGPQIVQTLFDAGRRRAQVEEAQAAYDATVANYRQTSLSAFQEVEDNLSSLRILGEEADRQHEAVVAAQKSLELTLNRYKGGLVTYLDVITEQSIALSDQRAETDILRRRMDASVRLIRALGGGWDTSQLPNG